MKHKPMTSPRRRTTDAHPKEEDKLIAFLVPALLIVMFIGFVVWQVVHSLPH